MSGVIPAAVEKDVDDDLPLPDLPPLPADPRWKVEHLGFLTAVSVALLLCAASAGFLSGGPAYALAAAGGVLIVTVSHTLTTLIVAWADTVRPALVMPLGMLTYVVKYSLFGIILAFGVSSDWPAKTALGLGVVAGVMVWTGVQAWQVTRATLRR
ncbi:hypothetical protein ACWT_7323 [Actinoplanes sp. SE50]|uniref:hypothetical protein n=1 Tax=unclassified Actinoplanes TaxID=2626549 RepID=UPI00023EDFA7|nr:MULTISPECIES: hypothetical protein [unclassified Actinoplanes]AEV88333.1 hypothetical protein ACPL_7453 [Actinoplanes sp. SE50/110]ATO86738.1 hypothetical protein ACWT_7323 [Actinoplanes sp. SE50]SLM04156.1 hypothetical protein ACSP50_7458 [Actinoplanes sp. SE50/110]